MKKYKHDYHSVKNLSRPQNELVKDLSRKKLAQIILFNFICKKSKNLRQMNRIVLTTIAILSLFMLNAEERSIDVKTPIIVPNIMNVH